jgi:hypothetical protein
MAPTAIVAGTPDRGACRRLSAAVLLVPAVPAWPAVRNRATFTLHPAKIAVDPGFVVDPVHPASP